MFERITTYLAEQFDFPKDSLHWDTTFKSLQLDSMDMVEMMMDMEEELGVDFDQNDMAELTTIGEVDIRFLRFCAPALGRTTRFY